MTEEIKKTKGFSKGNQAARKHGYYSRVLDDEERRDFKNAVEVEGIDEEIALLRVKIKSLVQRDPENLRLITHAMSALAKLVTIKYNLPGDDKEGVGEIIGNVLKNIALPIGIGIGSVLKK